MGSLTLAVLLLVAHSAPAQEPFPEGVVVERVRPGKVGDMAGMKPGDMLLQWHRASNGPSDAGTPERPILALDLAEVDREHLLRGPVGFRVSRAGQPLSVVAPWEAVGLGIWTRPAFPPGLLDDYERGRALADAGELDEAAAVWRDVADKARLMDDGLAPACWMLGRIGAAWSQKDVEASARGYGEAVACAEKLGPQARFAVLVDQGETESPPAGYRQRMDAYREALRVCREAQLGTAAEGSLAFSLAQLGLRAGDREGGLRFYRESVAAFEVTAPASPSLARTLAWLANSMRGDGEVDAAGEALARAAAIAEKTTPEGPTMATILSAQDMAARDRGDLATAERLARRVLAIDLKLAPRGMATCLAQLEVGTLVHSRGDLDGAEDWYRGALELAEGLEQAQSARGVLLHHLGLVALEKGDLSTAETYLRRALDEYQKMASQGQHVVGMLTSLGEVLHRRGDRDGARPPLERALALSEKDYPAGSTTAEVLASLGGLQRDGGEMEAAEASYARALTILERVAPSGALVARVLHGLGSIQRTRGQPERAAAHFARAVEVLEGRRGLLGTTGEARSLFSSNFYGVYHDHVEVLVNLGRVSDAFRVSETARARGLLTLMAERDLVLEDAPPELERQRRQLDAEYERGRAELKRLGAGAEAQLAPLGVKLRELRERQSELMDRIRQASPRLAEFRDPQPLDSEGIRAALDPGTAFLTYSVGARSTVLFVLGPGRAGERGDDVETVVIPLGAEALRPRIAAWRRLAERSAPPPEFFAEARTLYDLLIRPVERHLSSAERLVLSPDGPLHQLPFAALRRDGAYLAEWKPLTLVPSGTVLAQLVKSRPAAPGAPSLVAFGDPRAPGVPPLPGGRGEVAAITRLFPGARAYLGGEATEERMKGLGQGTRYLHFAGHGLLDERLPLESALALSPAPSAERPGDGRLHAWEIFERVRLKADLVTLSACRSAAGTEVAGEGVLGLTRAFQYAGARSVMASLWRVPDKSTPAFMRRFYGSLKQGMAKDEALQRAQVASIRAGHHPVRWATFQLYGDWR